MNTKAIYIAIYKAITFAYLASLAIIFVWFPAYTGVVFTTMLFWLSVRGVIFEKLLVGATIPWVPIEGKGVRMLSAFLLCLSVYFYYLIATKVDLNPFAVGLLFVYIPAVMVAATMLKNRERQVPGGSSR